MDITHFNGQRDRAWAVNMINLEAGRLTEAANRIGDYHLKDGLSRLAFLKETKDFIENQFAKARKAKTSSELLEPFKAIREENEHLKEQDRLMRMRVAQIYATVEFVIENNKVVGYIITGVNLVLAGLSIFAGGALMATFHPIAVVAGVVLVADSMNTFSKEYLQRIVEKKSSEGLIADGFMETADFLGFSPKVGLATYKSVSLAANTYNVFGLIKKKGTLSLFRFVSQDFYRNADRMSKTRLTIKVVGFGLEAKAIIGLGASVLSE